MIAETVDNLTRSFTRQQRREVNLILDELASRCIERINTEAKRIREMDKRPHKTHSPEKPNVYFPYVAQAMLEDFITVLQAHV